MSLESFEQIETEVLKNELLEMREEDQKMRNSGNFDHNVDIKNTTRMKEIISEFGFPTISKVGVDGYISAWLIIQHADMDVAFQEECLALLKSLSKEDVRARDIAQLEDRINISKELPQKYGTQFIKGEGGKWILAPLENENLVEQYRTEVGLPTLTSYIELMNSNSK